MKDREEYRERSASYRARLEEELNIIKSMGFPGYFLIVADFINYAKTHGIPVGPGRGSGASSAGEPAAGSSASAGGGRGPARGSAGAGGGVRRWKTGCQGH